MPSRIVFACCHLLMHAECELEFHVIIIVGNGEIMCSVYFHKVNDTIAKQKKTFIIDHKPLFILQMTSQYLKKTSTIKHYR